jgi:SAM-dependent methyltransferase
MSSRVREDCRLCGGHKLERVLELPATPLANEFPRDPTDTQETFPLWLAACQACGHVQLPVVVDPKRLFAEYVYVSGTSPVFVEHFRRYASDMIRDRDLKPGDLVVEIGSNDGTLLRFFKEAGMRVLGVDPAREIATRATESGIDTWCQFFDEDSAEWIRHDLGPAKLVLANNVFAHADNLASIARGVRKLLAPDGAFVFEVSYLPDVIAGTLFDTIYHEHLSYHSVGPLIGFFRRHGMSLVSARRVNTHGGSLRAVAVPTMDAVLDLGTASLIAEERAIGLGRDTRKVFDDVSLMIEQRRDELLRVLRQVSLKGGRIAAYGAPAKATTLLHTFGAAEYVDFVIDDSPHKQGRWMPGGRIPVYTSEALELHAPHCVVVLAWNFAESILEKLSEYRGAGGRCVVPLPTVRII